MRRDQSESTGKERVSKKISASGLYTSRDLEHTRTRMFLSTSLPNLCISLIELELERLNLLRSGYIQKIENFGRYSSAKRAFKFQIAQHGILSMYLCSKNE